ncbi:3-keto-disaccharide hydrolase [Spirosoma areae]
MNLSYLLICLSLFLLSITGQGQELSASNSVEGRWDIVVDMAGKRSPAWLEIRHSGHHTLVGRVMFMFGSARPIAKINYTNGKFDFSVPPQWDKGNTDLQFEGTVSADSLTGTVKYVDNKVYTWTGGRAPSLRRNKAPQWGSPQQLFNGKDIQGWHTTGQTQWIVESGVLKSPTPGTNLITDKVFTDFKLHAAFRYPKGGNSGIYLRGRYEVQVTDSKGVEPLDDQFGGVYGLLAPNEMVAKDAGDWQSIDITLIGRRVTIVANGIPVITDQVIPGITGGALDSREGDPGPIMLQGDHEPIEFRDISITPVKQ